MNLSKSNRGWSWLFLGAALFNYAIGFPLLLARHWSFDLSYVASVGRDPMAMLLWAFFGFAVILIGFGYHIISRDVTRNRGIVILGILAKLFDVLSFTTLFFRGLAQPIVLIPASIDGLFVLAFLMFWFKGPSPEPARITALSAK